MSRIGKIPIPIPSGVEVSLDGKRVSAKGSKGELVLDLHPKISVLIKDANVEIAREGDDKTARAMHGTSRSLISNMIDGVGKGFSKTLEVQGVGFRSQVKDMHLVLTVGFSHSIEFPIPEGIEIKVDGSKIEVFGPNKQLVGQTSARIRSFCPAEPYKGKGIKYKDEQIRRKAGKTVA